MDDLFSSDSMTLAEMRAYVPGTIVLRDAEKLIRKCLSDGNDFDVAVGVAHEMGLACKENDWFIPIWLTELSTEICDKEST